MIEIRISINVFDYFSNLKYVSAVGMEETFRTLSVGGRKTFGSRLPEPR
jgi:hypothetical protein